MIRRQDSNYHGAYHRGRSQTRRMKLPPIPERAGRSPVRRRVPRVVDAVEDRDDHSTDVLSTSMDRMLVKSMKRLSAPSMPSRNPHLPILPPAHLDETGDAPSDAVYNPNGNSENGSNAIQPESLSDAITPSVSNISRKHISTVIGSSCDDTRSVSTNRTESKVKYYAPEPTWMDFQQSTGATMGTIDEPPELSSIPTDEIVDSFVECAAADEIPDNDDYVNEMTENTTSRETRDQYQLERLQTRINQRREMQTKIIYKERGIPNYKTLRSSRIKSVRNLYNLNPSSLITCQEYPSHASIANTRSSTIPSLKHGHKVSPSLASSVSPLRSSLCDTELSEYRGKAFAEMLQLLSNNPSLNQDSQLADASNLDAIAHNLVELEMSRILNDFEQNNSLIEKSCTAASNAITSGANSDGDEECEPASEYTTMKVEDNVPPPEKITFNDTVVSITSKLSDVTSPTCHDGFELDEIIPTPHRLSRWDGTTPTTTTTNYQRNKIFSKTPSPVAAAAASVAASILSGSGGNKQYGDVLPSVLEFPEPNDLDDSSNDHEINVTGSPRAATSARFTHIMSPGSDDNGASKSMAKRVAEEEVNFHDEILSTVANDAEELMEVLSILSKYEEKEIMSKKAAADSTVGVLPFDESGSSKKVTFIEPFQQGPVCGCVIQ